MSISATDQLRVMEMASDHLYSLFPPKKVEKLANHKQEHYYAHKKCKDFNIDDDFDKWLGDANVNEVDEVHDYARSRLEDEVSNSFVTDGRLNVKKGVRHLPGFSGKSPSI